MFKIAIPKPCHQNWQEMSPTAKGAFCQFCAKEVVDFTQMSDDEVQNYFIKNKGTKTCGRLTSTQLQRVQIFLPEHIFYQKMAGWKKFMAICLLAFGSMIFGCDVKTENENLTKEKTTHVQVEKNSIVNTFNCDLMLGKVSNIKSETVETYTTVGVIFSPLTIPPTENEIDSAAKIKMLPKEKVIEDYDNTFSGGIIFEKIISTNNIYDSSTKKIITPISDSTKNKKDTIVCDEDIFY